MDKKSIVIVTVFITVLVFAGAISLYLYEFNKHQDFYELGYKAGNTDGLLYTYQTGNVALIENETLTEKPIGEVCNILIQQQLNLQEKK